MIRPLSGVSSSFWSVVRVPSFSSITILLMGRMYEEELISKPNTVRVNELMTESP